MTKLPRLTATELLPALKKDGWYEVASEGSHLQMRHATKRGKVSLAMHAGRVIPPYILISIPRQAGLTADELRRLLWDGRDIVHRYHYAILLRSDPEQGGYWATVPALPGCRSQGDTLEEAIGNAREAIHLYINTLISEGEPIPEEDAGAQAVTIDIEAPAA